MSPLHAAKVAYVLSAMHDFRSAARWEERTYAEVAGAIVDATDDPEDEVQLAAIGSFESGYYTRALGSLGEVGVWQLRPFPGIPVSRSLEGQARMALFRWKVMGRCSYTGEANRADGLCPLADHRYYRAFFWSHAHPFVAPPEPAPVALGIDPLELDPGVAGDHDAFLALGVLLGEVGVWDAGCGSAPPPLVAGDATRPAW